MEGKKKTLRSKKKNRNLDKRVNTKARYDYIEADYIDGVYDDSGNELIRPLTGEEKNWLDRYYSETIVTDFYTTPELKELKKKLDEAELEAGREHSSPTVKKLIKVLQKLQNEDDELEHIDKIVKLRKKIRKLEKNIGKRLSLPHLIKIRQDIIELQSVELLYSNKEEQLEMYENNNRRNECIYNKAKSKGMLHSFDTNEYDNYIADKYDQIYHIENKDEE